MARRFPVALTLALAGFALAPMVTGAPAARAKAGSPAPPRGGKLVVSNAGSRKVVERGPNYPYGVYPPTPEERRILLQHEEWRRTLASWHQEELQGIRDSSLPSEQKEARTRESEARYQEQMAQVLKAQEAERRRLWLRLTPLPQPPPELLRVLTLRERQQLEGLRKGKRDQIASVLEFPQFTPQRRRELLEDAEITYNRRYETFLEIARKRLAAQRPAYAQAPHRAPAARHAAPAPKTR